MQQGLEGLIWLGLATQGSDVQAGLLSKAFLLFGLAVWPLYVPVSVGLAEPSFYRRRVLLSFGIAGACLSTAYGVQIASSCYAPVVVEGHIHYAVTDCEVRPVWRGRLSPDVLTWTVMPYTLATLGPFLMSTWRDLQRFGGLVALSLLVTLIFYRSTLVSVWCFFAAVASLSILVFIERSRHFA